MNVNQYIANLLGEEIASLLNYKYTVFANYAIEVEGHKGIKEFSPTKIVVIAGKGQLVIEGKDLSIKQLTKNYALIVGTINWAGVTVK